MTMMSLSLPKGLKAFVDEQVSGGGFTTSGEYVRDLIRREMDRQHLRDLLFEGAASGLGKPAEAAYFDALRARRWSDS